MNIKKHMPYSARAVNALCTITKKYGAKYSIDDQEVVSIEVSDRHADRVLAVLAKVGVA